MSIDAVEWIWFEEYALRGLSINSSSFSRTLVFIVNDEGPGLTVAVGCFQKFIYPTLAVILFIDES